MGCKKGFREIKGRCVRISKSSSRYGGKSYNPFKMWGSYVGLSIYLILSIIAISYLSFPENLGICNSNFIACQPPPNIQLTKFYIVSVAPVAILSSFFGLNVTPQGNDGGLPYILSNHHTALVLIAFISSIIIGFLLGWVIHSIFRRLRQ